jgi:hypothetical protein
LKRNYSYDITEPDSGSDCIETMDLRYFRSRVVVIELGSSVYYFLSVSTVSLRGVVGDDISVSVGCVSIWLVRFDARLVW